MCIRDSLFTHTTSFSLTLHNAATKFLLNIYLISFHNTCGMDMPVSARNLRNFCSMDIPVSIRKLRLFSLCLLYTSRCV